MNLMDNISSSQNRTMVINIAGAIVGVSLVVLLALCLQSLFTHEVPQGNKDALLVVIGMLTVKIGTIVDFFYGSSESNRRSSDTINTLAETAKQTAATASQVVGGTVGDQSINLKPGETANATATVDGTQITKE